MLPPNTVGAPTLLYAAAMVLYAAASVLYAAANKHKSTANAFHVFGVKAQRTDFRVPSSGN